MKNRLLNIIPALWLIYPALATTLTWRSVYGSSLSPENIGMSDKCHGQVQLLSRRHISTRLRTAPLVLPARLTVVLPSKRPELCCDRTRASARLVLHHSCLVGSRLTQHDECLCRSGSGNEGQSARSLRGPRDCFPKALEEGRRTDAVPTKRLIEIM